MAISIAPMDPHFLGASSLKDKPLLFWNKLVFGVIAYFYLFLKRNQNKKGLVKMKKKKKKDKSRN